MITWDELVYALNKLNTLENGGGSEIEFEYNGIEYVIVCYKDWCSLAAIYQIGKYTEKVYNSIEELGAANDFGFCLKDVWKELEYPICRPSFDEFTLPEILDAYNTAWDKRRKCESAGGNLVERGRHQAGLRKRVRQQAVG